MRHIRNNLTALGTAVVLVACGSDANTNPNEGSVTSPTAAPTAVAIAASTTLPNPYNLDDRVDAHTTLASAANALLDGADYGGDIVAREFTCNAIADAASYDFEICVISGTNDSPFAFVIGDEYVDQQQDTATTSLLYQVF